MDNTAIMGLMIHSSHQLNNVKKRVVERKGNILAAQTSNVLPLWA